MEKTYLDVPFAQKDEAKALGARWDREARKWYVPAGVELVRFERWTVSAALRHADGSALLVTSSTEMTLRADPGELDAPGGKAGISLSQLLDAVSDAVSGLFTQPVWVRVEVVNARASNGHVFLELAEREPEGGRLLAKTNAAIWAGTAARLLPIFEERTGAQIAPGIKLLVQARPVFKAQYGFSLEISGIDPEYTLGDLEASKREIRARLKKENLFDRNRGLPPPWDFQRVVVLAPHAAAGLGDFQAEAERLQAYGICRFTYVYSRFQGEGAAAEMVAVLRDACAQWERDGRPDAVAIIRGGGAANDLAWLNDYSLARLVCKTPVPVLTGIGHERDNTILDEVANTRFDTPSKVIGGIERTIKARTDEVGRSFESVASSARQAIQSARRTTTLMEGSIQSQALQQVAQTRETCLRTWHSIGSLAKDSLHVARRTTVAEMQEVRHGAGRHIQHARQAAPAWLAEVQTQAASAVATTRMGVRGRMDAIVERAQADVRLARRDSRQRMADLTDHARDTVTDAGHRAQSLFREVAGQGPRKTLSRGFAIVRRPDGAPVTSAAQSATTGSVRLQFHDGDVSADIHNFSPGDKP